MANISVIITSFNRRELTLQCLDALFTRASNRHSFTVHLLDDGSTDGTADAICARYPSVRILPGNGQMYWNRGMRAAWEAALAPDVDFYLWLNDDTILRADAIDEMVTLQERTGPKTIVCGRISDPTDGSIAYGGVNVIRHTKKIFGVAIWTGIRTEPARKDDIFCDTFHGNCVLIPASATDDIGLISEHYWHSEGDTDYGLRAIAAGYKICPLPEPVAVGSYNAAFNTQRLRLTPKTWRFIFFHPKGRRLSESYHFYRQHLRPNWRLRLVWSYVRMLRVR